MENDFLHYKIKYLGNAAYPPLENHTILRFMSMSKFEHLMRNSVLYLCRLDRFDDKNEGLLTKANLISLQTRAPNINPEIYIERINKVRRWAYANCWYISKSINRDMFKFGPIVIESCVRVLGDSLSNCRIGRVIYIDEKTFMPEYDPYSICIHKRETYKEENELRIVHVDEDLEQRRNNDQNPEKFVLRPIKLSNLIFKIYVDQRKKSLFQKVEALARSHGIDNVHLI